jgi:hypothetical protein
MLSRVRGYLTSANIEKWFELAAPCGAAGGVIVGSGIGAGLYNTQKSEDSLMDAYLLTSTMAVFGGFAGAITLPLSPLVLPAALSIYTYKRFNQPNTTPQ